MEEKNLQRLLDMLYNMIDEAKSAPFSAEKCTINRDRPWIFSRRSAAVCPWRSRRLRS